MTSVLQRTLACVNDPCSATELARLSRFTCRALQHKKEMHEIKSGCSVIVAVQSTAAEHCCNALLQHGHLACGAPACSPQVRSTVSRHIACVLTSCLGSARSHQTPGAFPAVAAACLRPPQRQTLRLPSVASQPLMPARQRPLQRNPSVPTTATLVL